MQFVYSVSGIDPSLEQNSLQRAVRKFCKKLKVPIYVNNLTYNSSTNTKEAKMYFGFKRGADVTIEKLFKDPVYVKGTYYDMKITREPDEMYEKELKSNMYGNHGTYNSSHRSDIYKDNQSETSRNMELPDARDRSRSPLSQETSALAMELKLIEKQKREIEEKRRLLLEGQRFNSKKVNKQQKKKFVRKLDIPLFIVARKVIHTSMKPLIARVVPSSRWELFMQLYRPHLRMAIAMTVVDNGRDLNDPNLTTTEIATMYRQKHPVESDEAFVLKVLRLMKHAYWPEKKKVDGKLVLVYNHDDCDDHALQPEGTADISDTAEAAEISHGEDVYDESIDDMEQVDDNDELNDTVGEDWSREDLDWL